MKKLRLEAHAKINLTLDITGVRADGYHLLRSIMHEVGLCDAVTVEAEPAGVTEIQVSTDKCYIPCDGKNTMYKAAAAFCEALGTPWKVFVHAEKVIPVGAGLGGGSSDAAAVLLGLNQLTNAGFSSEKLCEIGLKVGADVPFCILGGTAIVTGIGEKLEGLPTLPSFPLVICKPRNGISTPVMYKEYDRMEGEISHPDSAGAEAAALAGDVRTLCRYVKNVFTPVASVHRPEVPEIKNTMMNCGALVSEMSGSGSAVFGIFETLDKAKAAAEELGRSYESVFLTSL